MTHEEILAKADAYAKEAERLSRTTSGESNVALTMATLARYWLDRAMMTKPSQAEDIVRMFQREAGA